MIPKPQYFDALSHQEFFTRFILLHPFRHTVLKTVKLDVQFRVRTIKIENINSQEMLSAEFKTGKTMSSQRAPELLFLVGLVAAKLAGGLNRSHG
jgi:hypothetical protein